MANGKRLDAVLVERGLAATRSRAADAVRRGTVRVDGAPALKPGMLVAPGAAIAMADPAAAYVSRAALKLVHALDRFALDPQGRACLDLGASTGGFTQVLLARGAAKVHAVDVGHGQLHESIRGDRRVVVHEGLNARDLNAGQLGAPVDAIVADVSFIGLRLALPPALALAAPGCWLAVLVKPQFEVGPAHIGKGGIVGDAALGEEAVRSLAAWLERSGWPVIGWERSPILGGDGNAEYVLGARRGDGAA